VISPGLDQALYGGPLTALVAPGIQEILPAQSHLRVILPTSVKQPSSTTGGIRFTGAAVAVGGRCGADPGAPSGAALVLAARVGSTATGSLSATAPPSARFEALSSLAGQAWLPPYVTHVRRAPSAAAGYPSVPFLTLAVDPRLASEQPWTPKCGWSAYPFLLTFGPICHLSHRLIRLLFSARTEPT